MVNIIKPRDFLMRIKSEATTTVQIRSSDLLEVAELGVKIPLSETFDGSFFYGTLKKAVTEFNSDAYLNGNPSIDFDDLHTKYSEYVEVLKIFVRASD